MFVHVEIDPDAAADADLAKRLVEVCPVNIFEQGAEGSARVVEENEDECVLCDLCVQAAPHRQGVDHAEVVTSSPQRRKR